MKKAIYVLLVVLSAGVLSSFAIKNHTVAAKHATAADSTPLQIADAGKARVASDRTQLQTAD